MAMTVADWQLHVTKLEAELAALEASPRLAEAKQLVADLKAELLKLSGTWYSQAELNAALGKKVDIENQLRKARWDLKVATGEDLKTRLMQARYSLAKAEKRANNAVMFSS